jgi:uncharacterized cupredoxin-like copper-binding protein
MKPMPFAVACALMATAASAVGFSIGPGTVLAQTQWQTVEIKADEYSFTPRQIQAKANRPLELVIENEGHEPHQFRSELLKDQMVEVEIGQNTVRGRSIEVVEVAPGKAVRIKLLSPPAGEFDFQCRIPSHHGMDGIIRIQAGG